jgi:hypothetical protein
LLCNVWELINTHFPGIGLISIVLVHLFYKIVEESSSIN